MFILLELTNERWENKIVDLIVENKKAQSCISTSSIKEVVVSEHNNVDNWIQYLK